MSEVKVLFVCSANMCRSPMAEGLARQFLTERGFSDFQVASAGTYGFRGYPPVANAIEAMVQIGIDIQDHRSQDLHSSLVREMDLLVVMSPHHALTILEFDASAAKKIVELWQYADQPEPLREIEDPVGQDLAAFIECRSLLQQCITNWLEGYLAT